MNPEVVCVVGGRLQSDYSVADSLGLAKALGYCAECAPQVVHGIGVKHAHDEISSHMRRRFYYGDAGRELTDSEH
jgi:hypothetical protein